MKKPLLLILALAYASLSFAQFTTPNTGVKWNFDSLVARSNQAVMKDGNAYMVMQTIIIQPKDELFVDHDITVKFNPQMGIIVESGKFTINAPTEALFTSVEPCVFTNKDTYWACFSVKDSAQIRFKKAKITNGGGIKVLLDATKGVFELDSCELSHNINNSSSTLFVSTSAAIDVNRGVVRVKNSKFVSNYYPAFASAANGGSSFFIKNCYLEGNVVSNGNRPQINLGPCLEGIPSEIVGNTVIGDRSFTNVGGISTSSLLAVETSYRIDSNIIKDNRYGITLTGSKITASISYNEILNNNTNTNVATGGSGINITSSGGNSHTVLTGNIIDGHHWGITLVGKTSDYSAGPTANLGNLDVPKTDPQYNPGLNIFRNNGNAGLKYDLYNNGPHPIMAQGNTWAVTTQDSASIETTVVHKVDNEKLGFVTFMYHGQNTRTAKEQLAYRVYPNPTSDYVNFDQTFDKAEVFNLFGQRVVEQHLPSNHLDLSYLPEGMYLIRLHAGHGFSTVKIQVKR